MDTEVKLKRSTSGHKGSLKIKVKSMPYDTSFLGHFARISIVMIIRPYDVSKPDLTDFRLKSGQISSNLQINIFE